MGHDPDPVAEAGRLRELIRDAHAAVKDLRAAIRDTEHTRAQLAAEFHAAATEEIERVANHMQAASNEHARDLNIAVEAARQEIAARLFDARIEYDEAAGNFRIVIPGARFIEDTPAPYPERT